MPRHAALLADFFDADGSSGFSRGHACSLEASVEKCESWRLRHHLTACQQEDRCSAALRKAGLNTGDHKHNPESAKKKYKQVREAYEAYCETKEAETTKLGPPPEPPKSGDGNDVIIQYEQEKSEYDAKLVRLPTAVPLCSAYA